MKPETEIDETGSFGEPEEKPAPFWKRSVWGISVATWGLCAVVLLAAIWYLFLRAPSEQACLRLMMRMLAYRPGKPHKNHHLPFSPLRL